MHSSKRRRREDGTLKGIGKKKRSSWKSALSLGVVVPKEVLVGGGAIGLPLRKEKRTTLCDALSFPPGVSLRGGGKGREGKWTRFLLVASAMERGGGGRCP